MRFGVVYPQTEYGNDPAAIRDYAQTAEGLGYSHVAIFDHVLGANPDRPGGLKGPYTYQSPFHEPFVLFGFMAAVTHNLEFAPTIIILPQRQTALVARQAATLDVLSGGRLRLGVGLGWNEPEYIALGENFHNRGRRLEEQITVLRLLWTQPLVDFKGRWHTLPDVGLNPLPVQRPIPIWFGGHTEAALRRMARLGDGWATNYRAPAQALPAIGQLEAYLAEAGRERDRFGIEARIHYGDGDPGTWVTLLQEWQAAGATYIQFNTMGSGLDTPGKHLKAIRTFAETVGVA